jgi:urease accessory protein
MNPSTIRRLLTAVAIAIPTAAQAHPGHGTSEFSAGALHPVFGMDHLVAMIAVGLLSATLGGRARWILPLVFAASLALGAFAGAAGLIIPGIEHGIALSVLILGAILAFSARLQISAAAAIIAISGAFHGLAHGIEIPADANGFIFGLGFVLSSALLHAIGIAIGQQSIRTSRPNFIRYAGAAAAVFGAVIFLS